ncbi:MAG TPA: NAD(P)/FAD-dependent oxidoreductase [Kofleriaceae bacterium]|nr:NAD(P)/FAD-dependent oxidoreductase [Kofleriaceae bacterium]
MSPDASVDVAVVGGGPAGLSAALLLARCRRRVVVFDGGHHRNDGSGAVHGFLSRDGIAPAALREIGRNELRHYGARVEDVVVQGIVRDGAGFTITTANGDHVRARRVLLATGTVDVQPPIAGAAQLHGRLVLPCPYCDGWEHRDRPLAVHSHADDRGARYALLLAQWSSDITFLPGRAADLSAELRATLAARGLTLDERALERVDEDHGELRLTFGDGSARRFAAFFYHLGCTAGQSLAVSLGAALDDRGGIAVDRHNATSVPGVYAAGDATRDALQAIVGAGEGAVAAIAINQSLVNDDLSGSGR